MKDWWNDPRARAWRYRLSRLGWPMWAGLAAMLAAVAVGPLVIDPMREQAAEWEAQAQQARRERASRPADAADTAQRQAQDFVATLPTGDAALAAVQDLHRLALRGVGGIGRAARALAPRLLRLRVPQARLFAHRVDHQRSDGHGREHGGQAGPHRPAQPAEPVAPGARTRVVPPILHGLAPPHTISTVKRISGTPSASRRSWLASVAVLTRGEPRSDST